MRFSLLGSGSRGNACLIEAGNTCVMVDCGFSVEETEYRLARLDKAPDQLAAILVTHEHGDHIKGVGAFAQKYRLPVWMTHGTWAQARSKRFTRLGLFCTHEAFVVGDLCVEPYPVPHDAREPSQFVFSDGARRIGLLTDTGSSTPHIEACLAGCDALLLECNHDVQRLEEGDYPMPLKERIKGAYGHLSNEQAAAILGKVKHPRLQHVVALHLSAKHNTPAFARAVLSAAINCAPAWIGVADQELGLEWRMVD